MNTRNYVPLEKRCGKKGSHLSKETLDWIKTHDPWARAERIPWEQQDALRKQGLPCSNRYASRLVQKFADIPLEEYFAQEQDGLRALMEHASPGELRTYQDAADLVYRLHEKESYRWSSEDDTEWTSSRDLMVHLLKPLFWYDKKKPLPFVMPFLKAPFPTVLYGTALLAREPLLQWRIEDVKTNFLDETPGARPERMCDLLRLANTICGSEEGNDGYNLFFILTVEPFYLMGQADKPPENDF